jgi:large subunit ribosomal protein L30e
MARKKSTEKYKDEIKKLSKTNLLIIGTQRVIKLAKLGKLELVYVSVNAPATVKESLDYYSKLGKFEIIHLQYANDELSEFCNKPFAISVLGVMKK